MRTILKSKIHAVTITETNLNYGGSITISRELMEAADIMPYEQVHVLNLNNGNRFETYAIYGKKDEICLNGACARLGVEGDRVIILSYQILSGFNNFQPKCVYVDEVYNTILVEVEPIKPR